MQVLIIAVQNVVPYGDLGAATSGATFFRSIGGSFGTAVFGAIFSAQLGGNLRHYLAGGAGPVRLQPPRWAAVAVLAKLPPAIHLGYQEAFAASLHTVFLVAVPISAVAFALTWLLQEVPLRQTSHAPDPGAEPGPHRGAGRVHLAGRDGAGAERPGQRAESGPHLRAARRPGRSHPRRCRVLDALPNPRAPRRRRGGAQRAAPACPRTRNGCAEQPARPGPVAFGEPAARPAAGIPDETGVPGGPPTDANGRVTLTAEGQAAAERLVTARRDALSDLVKDWDPEHHAELAAMLTRLARQLAEGPAPVPAAAERAPAG